MKIATLQFNPQIGQIAANFSRAESLLMREEREGMLRDLDLLVLPELAFTGLFGPPSLFPLLSCPSLDDLSTRVGVRDYYASHVMRVRVINAPSHVRTVH